MPNLSRRTVMHMLTSASLALCQSSVTYASPSFVVDSPKQDALIVALVAELTSIGEAQRTLYAAYPEADCADIPNWIAIDKRLNEVIDELADSEAKTLRGCQAKARALRMPIVEEISEWTGAIAASLADDLLHLDETA